jgi:hypothetical protein
MQGMEKKMKKQEKKHMEKTIILSPTLIKILVNKYSHKLFILLMKDFSCSHKILCSDIIFFN